MSFSQPLKRTAVLAATLLLAACAGKPVLKKQAYLLAYPSGPTNLSQSQRPQLVMRTVSLPEYLDRSELIYREGAHRLQPYPHAEWGERPAKGLTRWWSAALAAQHPAWQVVPFTSTDGRLPVALLTVHLNQAEADAAAGTLHLQGEWSLSLHGKTTDSGSLRAQAALASASPEASIAALEQALAATLPQIRLPDAQRLPPAPP